MTTPVTTQGPTAQGMSQQQRGYMPGFPPPFGLEQYLGQPSQHGGFPQYGGSPQQYGGFPQSHMQAQFPGQQQLPWLQSQNQHNPQTQQIVQSLVSQLLPIAQQVILPQVVATATQQITAHLQQFVAQQVTWQLAQQGGWQQPYTGQTGGWQQTQFGQPGQFGQSYQGSF